MGAKTALVTGSSSRLGKMIAESLVRDGYKVIIHGRDEARGIEAKREVKAKGLVVGRLESTQTFEMFVKAVDTFFDGELGLLVNNASTFVTDERSGEVTPTWMGFATAMESAKWVYTLNNVLHSRLRRGDGLSIALTDRAAADGWERFVAHGAAKMAIESMQRHMDFVADEYQKGKPRFASLRLPTVLVPDGMEGDTERLERLYGPIYPPDCVMWAISEMASHANWRGSYELAPNGGDFGMHIRKLTEESL